MNKEQIGTIALEVANETIVHIAADAPSSKYQIVQFATCFLARVDAERAKEEPVAWRQETGYLEPYYLYHSTDPKRGIYEPLYLHPQPQPIPEDWNEAAIAWEVCASIHREYAKGKDALFKTRQQDFLRYARAAREAMLAAAPEGYKPPTGLVEILEEAADILCQAKPMRYPIVDELHGFAAMLAAAPKP